ncbi:MAG: hypothetical protein Fues2KO_42710 [Fuerstiella sp.]
MSAETTIPRSPDGRLVAIVLATACAGLTAAGAFLAGQPLIAVGALLVLPIAAMGLRYPESSLPLVLFLIYSNAVVVAVRFHGVPSVAAMLVPVPLLIPFLYHVLLLRGPFVVGPALPWLLAFVGWQLISVMFSRMPQLATEGLVTTICEGLLLYLLLTNVIRTPRTLKISVWSLIAAGAFMGSVSVYQQATRSFDSNLGGFGQLSDGRGFEVADGRGTVRQRRMSGPIGEKNRYAQIMLMLFPLAMSRVWVAQQLSLRGTAVWAALMIGAGATLTFSRSGAVAFVLMLGVAVMLRVVTRRQVALLALGGLVVLLAIPQYRVRLATIPAAIGLLDSSASQEEPDGAMRGRATEMLAAARMAVDHPLFGVGPDCSGHYTREYGQAGGLRHLEGARESHCMYVELPAENGVPGMLIFLGMLAVSLGSLVRGRNRLQRMSQFTVPEGEQFVDSALQNELDQTAAALLLAMTAYLVMGIFLHMSYVRYFWIMLAMVDACTLVIRRCESGSQIRRFA